MYETLSLELLMYEALTDGATGNGGGGGRDHRRARNRYRSLTKPL
jgi:hypothetical protein